MSKSTVSLFLVILICAFTGVAYANITAYEARNKITVDGDVGDSEWAGVRPIEVTSSTGMHPSPSDYNTAADLSYTLRVAHKKNVLYVAFVVSDSELFDPDGPALHHDDSVEIYVDGDYEGRAQEHNEEGFQIVCDFTGSEMDCPVAYQKAVKRLPTGYSVEFAIPFSSIDTRHGDGKKELAVGDVIRFHVSVNDDDAGHYRDSQLFYNVGGNVSQAWNNQEQWLELSIK